MTGAVAEGSMIEAADDEAAEGGQVAAPTLVNLAEQPDDTLAALVADQCADMGSSRSAPMSVQGIFKPTQADRTSAPGPELVVLSEANAMADAAVACESRV